MGLVDYAESDASGSDSDDDQQTAQQPAMKRQKMDQSPKGGTSNQDALPSSSTKETQKENPQFDKNESEKPALKLFSALPKPGDQAKVSRFGSFGSSLSDLVKSKTDMGRVKILAPTFDEVDSDSDVSDDESSAKRAKFSSSGVGSCLTTILPKPKNVLPSSIGEISTKIATNTSLVPHTVTRSRPQLPKPVKTSTTLAPRSITKANKDLDQEEEAAGSSNDFFSLSEDSARISDRTTISSGPLFPTSSFTQSLSQPVTARGRISTAPEIHVPSSSNEALHQPSTSSSSATVAHHPQYIEEPLDISQDVTLKKKILQKFGEETADDIQIIDVNVNQQLGSSNEWLKNISQESDEQYKYRGPAPTGSAKRKHQITYLAFQAKQRELELKNEWAKNRITKNQTRAKYGF